MERANTDGDLVDLPVAAVGQHARDQGGSASFLVPDYQRGYRWDRDEARQLLSDISTRPAGEHYYLQPIVVKRRENCWELIDGQQRMTTLYLLQRYLLAENQQGSGPTYELHYATREDSADFLKSLGFGDVTVNAAAKNIDFHHMSVVYDEIRRWCEANAEAVGDLSDALRDAVRLLWFEAPSSVTGEDMFRRLNSGRILLTDAELLKARFVSELGKQSKASEPFASQWDAFERDLADGALWAFIAGGPAPSSRIQLLLDTLADMEQPPPDPRPPFHTFHVLDGAIRDRGAQRIWDEVVGLHSRIIGWFADHDTYHRIGYLVAAQSATLHELATWASNMTAREFTGKLIEKVAGTLPDTWEGLLEQSYENPRQRTTLQRALLLMSVETMRKTYRERFPFSEHQVRGRMWSLEHIHAQYSKSIEANQRREWLDDHRRAVVNTADRLGAKADDLLARIDAAKNDATLTSQAFDGLKDDVLLALTPEDFDVDQMHSVSNLALLSREHNSALSNSAFAAKRSRIIDMDRAGEYVPVATRNLFLKYYTNTDLPRMYEWSEEDRKGYLEEMRLLLYPTEDDS